MTRPAMVAVAVLVIAAGLIGLIPDDPAAGALFSVIWAFALGFIWPRLVWFWPLIIGAWLPVGLLTRTLRDQPNGWPGCPNGVAYNWQIALAVFCAIVIFSGAGALVGFAIERLAALPAFRELRWVRFVKPVLAWGGIAVAVAIVFYSALALAQPLHPFAPGERYCWDEYCFRVDSVTRTRTLGPQSHPLVARGTFYVVNATLEAPWWGRLVWGPQSSFVVTRDGGEYSVSQAGQNALDAPGSTRSECHTVLGASEHETLVFDLPVDALQPRLLVRDTLGFEGLLGALRLGRLYVKPAFNLRYD